MATYSIVPRSGTYKLVTTAEDGSSTVVRSFATEADAVALLKRLQEKAGHPAKKTPAARRGESAGELGGRQVQVAA